VTDTFNGLFQHNLCKPVPEGLKPVWILMKQAMMGWQRHQLHHMQVVCTSFQTDNRASITQFLQAECSS